MNVLRPTGPDEVRAALLAAGPRVRIRGGGSRNDRLVPAADADVLDLSALDAIERLDAPDQTCTVGPGVTRAAIDQALDACGLELGCLGDGTLGGLCAFDPLGAAAPGAPSPRSFVLGMDAVLADGTVFRSGARVVKNVAGFDLHKLFVGSRGTLFAALRLHLRLRPKPRAAVWFASRATAADEALRTFVALRGLAAAPAVLVLSRDADGGVRVRGKAVGRAGYVATMLAEHRLDEAEPIRELHLSPPPGGEVVTANLAPSALPQVLGSLPAGSRFLHYGGGRSEITTASPAESDAVLAMLQARGGAAAVTLGEPLRRGHGTSTDAGARRLADGIKQALDPHGKFV
jgi:FAD/FMN-containing dehydrogenase